MTSVVENTGTLRVGIVGTGHIAQIHARSIVANPRLQLVAAHARNGETLSAFAQRFGARPEASLQALIAAPDVDAVVIASSTDTHSDVAIQVAEAGKPMYCEKPIDLGLARARDTARRVQATGVRVMMGFNRRFEPSYAEIGRGVAQGQIGSLQILQMTSRGPQNPPSETFLRTSGGFLRDKGVHFFDLARFLAGDEIEEVCVMGSARMHASIAAFNDFDTVVMQLRFRGGALCQIDNTRTASYGYDERIEAFGSEGLLEAAHLPQRPLLRTQGTTLVAGSFPQSNFERVGPSFAGAMSAFAAMVLDGATTAPALADGLAAQVVAEAAHLSATERRLVRVADVASASIATDPGLEHRMDTQPLIDLDRVLEQEARLQLPRFDRALAWELGVRLKDAAQARNVAVAIEVRLARERVFFYAMPGTRPTNGDWARRKCNTVDHTHRSSYQIPITPLVDGQTAIERMGLPLRDYASSGGGFPLSVQGVGCVGSVAVSGLPQRDDHELIVEVLAAMCGLSYSELKLP